jgi:hypothetical protein
MPLRCFFFQELYGYEPPNKEIIVLDISLVVAMDEMLQVRTNIKCIHQK